MHPTPTWGRVMEKCGFIDTGKEVLCPGLEIGGDKPVRVTMLEQTSLSAARTGRHRCLAKSKPGSYSHNCGGLFEMALLVVAVADAAKFGIRIGPLGVREMK